MIGEPEEGRLTAMMFTDMVGDSALSQRADKPALELLEEHRPLQAVELYEKAQAVTHSPSIGLAITYAQMRRREDARRILDQLIEKSRREYVAADSIAAN